MKIILSNYIKMIKVRFFHSSIIVSLLFIWPLFTNQFFGLDMEATGVLLFGILSFSFFDAILREISGKKYILLSALPIRIRDIIKIIYLHTYLVSFLTFIVNIGIGLYTNTILPKLFFVYSSMFTFICNRYYLYFTTDMNLNFNQESKKITCNALSIIAIGVVAAGLYMLAEVTTQNVYLYFSLIVFIASLGTLKSSYEGTVKNIIG